ncbi:uncharacterized protein LOC129956504 [Argiope bruennichi]|uniref:uncharacterized protein LOC129956504 n=1 Tax=Argiope bruennichi TaxID=94029 RepID=UPI002494F276|nr:uncharacterized protein LOC129956504 [Argiope bruennichi]
MANFSYSRLAFLLVDVKNVSRSIKNRKSGIIDYIETRKVNIIGGVDYSCILRYRKLAPSLCFSLLEYSNMEPPSVKVRIENLKPNFIKEPHCKEFEAKPIEVEFLSTNHRSKLQGPSLNSHNVTLRHDE